MIGLVQPSGAVKKKKITVKRKKKTLAKRRKTKRRKTKRRKTKRSIIIHAAAAAVIGNRSHKPVLQINFSCSPNSGCCLGFFIKIITK
ncbi:hypothetical protein HKK69_15155 [Bacillus velezensis]|nr:hypothetical protein [Bacillus velezensis]NMV99211.1 hypothetical protein [Bacillus velezensis]